MFKLKKHTKILAFVLAFVTIINVFVTTPTELKADMTTDVQASYIKMMKTGKSGLTPDMVGSFTKEDLRCLALFASNAYVPFTTVLTQDAEGFDKTKTSLITMMQAVGFDKNTSSTLAEQTLQATYGTAQPLYFDISSIHQPTKNFSNSSTLTNEKFYAIPNATWDSFGTDKDVKLIVQGQSKYEMLLGGANTNNLTRYPITLLTLYTIFSRYAVYDCASETSGRANDTTNYKGCYYQLYTSDGTCVAVITDTLISKLSYVVEELKTREATNVGKTSNAFVQVEDISTTFANSTPTVDKARLTLPGQRLYVDWVGNILADLGDKQVVIIPACMNDMVFKDSITGTSPIIGTSRVTWNQNVTNFVNILSLRWANYIKANANFHEGTNKDGLFRGTTWSYNYNSMPLRMHFGSTAVFKLDDYVGKGAGTLQNVCDMWSNAGMSGIATAPNSHPNFVAFNRFPYTDYVDINQENNDWVKNTNTILSFCDLITDVELDSNGQIKPGISSLNIFSADLLDTLDAIQGSSFGGSTDGYYTYNFSTAEKQILKYILYSYIFAASPNANAPANFRLQFNSEIFPSDTSAIAWDLVDTQQEDQIKSMVYYFLHPSEGINFISKWFKNKIGGLFISWHEDIVGGSNSNVTTGMTQYLSTSSYLTTPNLSDVEFLQTLLDYYDTILVFLLIIIMLVLICYVVIGHMTVWRMLSGVLIFAILSILPPFIITTSISASNSLIDRIYSKKFSYWAMVQTAEYLHDLTELNSSTTVNSYISTLLNQKKEADDEEISTFSGAKVKWMSPKHFASYQALNDKLEGISAGLQSVFTQAASDDSTEEFLEADNATYMYRDILDIYTYAAYGYELWSTYSTSSNETNSNDQIHFDAPNSNYLKYFVTDELYTDPTTGVEIKPFSLENVTYAKLVKANTSDTEYRVALSDDLRNTSSFFAIDNGFLYNPSITNSAASYWSKNTTRAASYFVNYASELAAIQRTKSILEQLENGTASINVNMDSSRFSTGADRRFTVTPFGASSISNPNESGLPLQSSRGMDKTFFGMLKLYNLDAKSIKNRELNGKNKYQDYFDVSMYFYETYAESVFYYFNNNIRDQLYATPEIAYFYNDSNLTANSENFYELLLNSDYFYNMNTVNSGYGEMKDFMNFHDLFYYVLPVLRAGNKNLMDFVSVHGCDLYDTCPLHYETGSGKLSYTLKYTDSYGTNKQQTFYAEDGNIANLLYQIAKDNEAKNYFTEDEFLQVWHNYNLMYLYNYYCSWANYMDACNYAKTETISVGGKTHVVKDPLDPTSYFSMDNNGNITSGRYMVFSKSEMKYYGLEEHQLTSVERKIMEVEDRVYKDALDLMNYYTLPDESLIHSYAMLQTFAFNSVFSQTSLVKDDYIIYPQAYEAKAFTYDAYLRMIMANNSTESLMTSDNTSIYKRILSKTSIFYGLVLILNDILAVYAIPGLRLFFVCIIFILSILIIIASALKLEFDFFGVLWKSLVSPLLSYIAITVGLGLITSLFMGQMAQGVVKTSKSIALGDPTMVLLVMIVINIAVLILYFKLCKKLWKDFKVYIKTIVDNMSAAIVGAVGTVTGIARRRHSHKAENALINGRANRFGNTVTTSARKTKEKQGAAGAVLAGAAGGAVGATVANKANKNSAQKSAKPKTNIYDNIAIKNKREKADKLREIRRNKADMVRQGKDIKQETDRKQGDILSKAKYDAKVENARLKAQNDTIKNRAKYQKQDAKARKLKAEAQRKLEALNKESIVSDANGLKSMYSNAARDRARQRLQKSIAKQDQRLVNNSAQGRAEKAMNKVKAQQQRHNKMIAFNRGVQDFGTKTARKAVTLGRKAQDIGVKVGNKATDAAYATRKVTGTVFRPIKHRQLRQQAAQNQGFVNWRNKKNGDKFKSLTAQNAKLAQTREKLLQEALQADSSAMNEKINNFDRLVQQKLQAKRAAINKKIQDYEAQSTNGIGLNTTTNTSRFGRKLGFA